MSVVKIIAVTKVKEPFHPNGKTWTIYSAGIEAEIDGQHVPRAEIKTFDKKCADKFAAGYIFECEPDENSKARGYDNVYTTKKGAVASGGPSGGVASPSASITPQRGSYQPRNEQSIMAQTCLKAASELMAGSGADPSVILAAADVFLEWVLKKSGVEPAKPAADKPADDLPY